MPDLSWLKDLPGWFALFMVLGWLAKYILLPIKNALLSHIDSMTHMQGVMGAAIGAMNDTLEQLQKTSLKLSDVFQAISEKHQNNPLMLQKILDRQDAQQRQLDEIAEAVEQNTSRLTDRSVANKSDVWGG